MKANRGNKSGENHSLLQRLQSSALNAAGEHKREGKPEKGPNKAERGQHEHPPCTNKVDLFLFFVFVVATVYSVYASSCTANGF